MVKLYYCKLGLIGQGFESNLVQRLWKYHYFPCWITS